MRQTGSGGMAVCRAHYNVFMMKGMCKIYVKDSQNADHRSYESSYLITILSNQGGITLKSNPKSLKADQKSVANFKGKANAVLVQLELPISIYAATQKDQYRKPRTGMWNELLVDHDLDAEG